MDDSVSSTRKFSFCVLASLRGTSSLKWRGLTLVKVFILCFSLSSASLSSRYCYYYSIQGSQFLLVWSFYFSLSDLLILGGEWNRIPGQFPIWFRLSYSCILVALDIWLVVMVVSSLVVKVFGGHGSSPCRWPMRFLPIRPPFGLRLLTVMGPVCMPLCSS